MAIVAERRWASVAFPILGAGSGGFGQARALELMKDELSRLTFGCEVVLVRYRPV
jgi:O-acetyl-ADP-ribose deacetylase (regulator of RNase III)